MVFAVWAGRRQCITPAVTAAFQESCAYGLRNLERIAGEEAVSRRFALDLVRRYLSSHIVYQLGPEEREGMQLFLSYARELPALINQTPACKSY